MLADAKEILKAALQLPENERFDLASRLLDTLPEDSTGWELTDPGLLDELKARSADPSGAVTWPQLRDSL